MFFALVIFHLSVIRESYNFFQAKLQMRGPIFLVPKITLYNNQKVFRQNLDCKTFSVLCLCCFSSLSYHRSEKLISGKIIKTSIRYCSVIFRKANKNMIFKVWKFCQMTEAKETEFVS